MFVYRIEYAAVLLFAITQSSILASAVDEKNKTEAWTKTIVRSMQVPLINGIRSAISSSESSCAKEIAVLSEAIDAQEMWALEMLDASSKIQSGILQGNDLDLGMYSQCIAVDGKYNDINVRGKHCIVTIGVETLTLTSSVCIPSSCNETQASQIRSSVMKNLLKNSPLEIEFETMGATCARIGSEDFTFGEILTIAFFTTVGAFILSCTICDLVKRSWPEKTSVGIVTTLAKFSLYTNALAILSTEVKPDTIPVINGIRFLSSCWIVVWHRYCSAFVEPFVNHSDYWPWFNSWNAVWLQMSTFAPDNFFLISGFLMSYMFFKSMRSGGESNFPMMFLHRYIRLTPAVAVVMLFVLVLYHRIGNGPLWKTTVPYVVDECTDNWWGNLLYIQNLLPSNKICLPQTWFLAADMQLFWISPIILYPLHRWPKYGLRVWNLFLLMSVVTPTVVVGVNGYSISGLTIDTRDSFSQYYIQSYTRAFPYLVGILLGYDIATIKRRPLTQVAVVFNWIVTCMLLILCCCAIHRLRNADIEYNLVLETFCAAIVRPCWSIAMVWIIYACIQGYGSIVARFLSLPIFVPLSRLSYGIYLVHGVIRFLRNGTSTIPGVFSDSELLNSYLGDMVLSMAVSGVISLFFESPVMILEKILKNSGGKRE